MNAIPLARSAPSSIPRGLLAAAIALVMYSSLAGQPAPARPPLEMDLDGDWRFATDPGDRGIKEKWFSDEFDDSGWANLVTGKSWRKQGVEHDGYGWFRRKIVLPSDYANIPLTLELGTSESDDDVWFNGVRVGGLHGKYKYKNLASRVYTVPPSLIRHGRANTLVTRVWGGDLVFIGESSQGLVAGKFAARLDPYYATMRAPGREETPAQLFDLSDAQKGDPFEIVFRLPVELADSPVTLQCGVKDFQDLEIANLNAPVEKGPEGAASAVIKIDSRLAQEIYLRGRFIAQLSVRDGTGKLLHDGKKVFDHLCFAKRDSLRLPLLPDASGQETPYGRLKLIDEIDCSLPLAEEPHPYLQSGFPHSQLFMTPGSLVEVTVADILGKRARESANGWFAYRIGRGGLKPHGTYLLRVEYPEDKPRYCPIEIQTGRNYMDVGWQTGIGPDDPYDPWPLSQAWQWYDTIVSLDEETTGTSGTYGAPIENGFWVYFLNKVEDRKYYSMYEGGPAVSRIKLYELDSEANAPRINLPPGQPQRTLMFDWERQADTEPEDQVRYAKLMGYNAVSPVIIKWGLANWSEPLNGYDTFGEDRLKYWVGKDYKPGTSASPSVPGKASQHEKFMAATKRWGIRYIPRIEYGGSLDLPEEVRAIGKDGKPAKPNRFGTWCADLLQPATWTDLQKLVDHLLKPYLQENPQLTGILWRIRQDRMPISYSPFDLALFAQETGQLPAGSDAKQRAWAASGAGREAYDAWWLEKRAQFHGKLAALLQSYRPGLKLYYSNWDADKFSLVLPSITSWAFNKQVITAANGDGRAVYQKDRDERKKLTGDDYIRAVRTGAFPFLKNTHRADYALRPELYRDIKGVEIFAPANALWCADSAAYLNYFQTAEGLAVSNQVLYDEIGARSINPRYEGSMITPAGPAFSMAFELLAWFHGDARTLTYTPYTYGRGFADAHRRFAQAFLALPAIPGSVLEQADQDVKIRTYDSVNGMYVGVASKGYAKKSFTVKIPGKAGATIVNLVMGEGIPASVAGGDLQFEVESGPMELNAYLIR